MLSFLWWHQNSNAYISSPLVTRETIWVTKKSTKIQTGNLLNFSSNASKVKILHKYIWHNICVKHTVAVTLLSFMSFGISMGDNGIVHFRSAQWYLHEREYLMIIFLISHRNHMLCPLIGTVSSRRFRWGVTTYVFMHTLQKLSLLITKYSLLSRALKCVLFSFSIKFFLPLPNSWLALILHFKIPWLFPDFPWHFSFQFPFYGSKN